MFTISRLLLNDEQVMHPQFYAEKGKKEFILLPSLGQFGEDRCTLQWESTYNNYGTSSQGPCEGI